MCCSHTNYFLNGMLISQVWEVLMDQSFQTGSEQLSVQLSKIYRQQLRLVWHKNDRLSVSGGKASFRAMAYLIRKWAVKINFNLHMIQIPCWKYDSGRFRWVRVDEVDAWTLILIIWSVTRKQPSVITEALISWGRAVKVAGIVAASKMIKSTLDTQASCAPCTVPRINFDWFCKTQQNKNIFSELKAPTVGFKLVAGNLEIVHQF